MFDNVGKTLFQVGQVLLWLFIICGSLMDTGGLSKRLINIANSLIGNVTGGLGHVAILACMFFGAISGSANATVAAIGAEAGWKWAAASVVYNTALAWFVAWIVYRIVLIF